MSEMKKRGCMEQETTGITISGLTKLCDELMVVRAKIDEIKKQEKEVSDEESRLEKLILNHLKEEGLPNFKGDFGAVSVVPRKSVIQPADMAEKMKFFAYLKEQNLLWEMVKVDSRTLSSWATKEIEAKEKNGILGWVPPGLKPPTEILTLSVRKK
jgi:hypothetical protein